MSRSLFGLWGLDLDDGQFAQALAAIGVLDALMREAPFRGTSAELAGQLQRIFALGEPVPFRLGSNISWLMGWPAGQPYDAPQPAETFRSAWEQAVGPVFRPRLEVNTERMLSGAQLDPFWLASALTHPAVSHGVYFRQEEPQVPLRWDWPLRIGLLDDPRSRELAATLQRSPRSRLFRAVEVGRVRRECDLLLLPYNLRSSLALILGTAERVTADCVVVLGGAKVSSARASELLRALRTETESGGVCVASVPKPRREEWFDAIIVELSHNHPFDVALLEAARRHGLRAPLLLASRRFIEVARLSSFVRRLGAGLAGLPESAGVISLRPETAFRLRLSPELPVSMAGHALRAYADQYDYVSESGDATLLVELRQEIEGVLRRPMVLAQANGGGESPPKPGPDLRTVQAEFFDSQSSEPAARVLSDQAYTLAVLIAEPDPEAGRIISDRPLPSLPPSPQGHRLTIILCELREGRRASRSPLQQTEIHLPDTGPSSIARFAVRTASEGRFVARIIVLHHTRVLQTLILDVPLSAEVREATLEEETIVQHGFAGLENRRRFDAALVLNHSEDAVAGITVATGTAYSFDEPEGLRDSVKRIEVLLSSLAKLPEKERRLDSQALLGVLFELAHHGKLAWDCIAAKAPPELGAATRIQVVEARDGAYLPVEFFYDAPAPDDGATICPHAARALACRGAEKCPHEANAAYICPTAFWGFKRVIERMPHVDLKDGKDFQLSQPTLERPRLEILTRALVGASNRVRAADVTGAKGIVVALQGVTPNPTVMARDWSHWKDLIQEQAPTLLVLLPHSLDDPRESLLPALEIGGRNLRAASLGSEYVRRSDSEPGPTVLLLGCSTELTSIAFYNFVARFRAKGAALVLGTLSTIRGRHAARFVARFVELLSRYVGQPDATFGDVLVAVKREMLAEGEPLVLSLVSYGDAEWRL